MIIEIIILCYLIFIAYLLAGLSTSDYRRLSGSANFSIKNRDCYCETCHHIIPITNQFPIFSFIVNKGKCQYCNSRIPILQFLQEIAIFLIELVVCFVIGPTSKVLVYMFLVYEGLKILYIIIIGRKRQFFWSEFLLSICQNMLLIAIFHLPFYLFKGLLILQGGI